MKNIFRRCHRSILFLVLFPGIAHLGAQSVQPVYPVQAITKQLPDTCSITGIVLSAYTCPPCPKGAQCKPCIGDHVMIGDSADAKNQFMVLLDDPGAYTKTWTSSWNLKWIAGEELPIYYCQDNRP